MVPVSGQKGLEIGCGNPHQSIEPVRDQKALIDPAPNGASADAKAMGDLFDREVLANFEWSDFITPPRVCRCKQSLKRTKRNKRPAANPDCFRLALFDEAPDGRVAETADLFGGCDRDSKRL